MNIDSLVGQLLMCLFIGLLVAFLAKGKEPVATTTLCLLLIFLVGVLLRSARFVASYSHPALLEILHFMFEYPIMIVLGGWIVRELRCNKFRSALRA